jgi:hypothetical protein
MTPPGGGPGTHGDNTARCNAQTGGQGWSVNRYDINNRWWITNAAVYDSTIWDLSSSAANPYEGGTYRVYTAAYSSAPAHIWRLYQPAGRPNCTPCG